MSILVHIPLILITAYLVASALYQFVLAVAAQFKVKAKLDAYRVFKKFLVLIPAYQEDEVILESVKKNMAISFQYPRTGFDLVVIADGLKRETIQRIEQMGAKVVKVGFEKSTKVKALQAAMDKYKRGYDGVVVLDADNYMNWDFLHRMNTYLHNGYKVIQGQRAPFNQENAIAMSDGMAEIANHKMLCRGANVLGLSSKLSGSGMVFDFGLFQKVITKLNAIGGFDKELELLFTKRNQHIAYAEDAIVYDHKVNSAQAYEVQRGRWLEAQYSFFRKHWVSGLKAVFEGKGDYFHKVFQLALPPRLLMPFALGVLAMVGMIAGSPLLAIIAATGLVMNVSTYLMVIPFKVIKAQGPKMAMILPRLIGSTMKALSLMKRSRTEFLHTPHQLVQS